MKIITGIKGNLLSVSVGGVDYVGKNFGFINFNDSKINKDDFEIDDQTYIKPINVNELIKIKDESQFSLIPKLISRLFCYIDDKNNVWVSSGITGKEFFGNLSIDGGKISINKIMMCDDLKPIRWEHPSDTLHHTCFFDIIENNELDVLRYILRFNRPENMENLYVGYINVFNEYIFSENDIEDGYEDYDKYKVGRVINDKLYNNPISIEILGKIDNGEIDASPITVKTIVDTNNSKNGL